MKVKSALSNKTGEGYIDTAVKMIIAVVLGSLLLIEASSTDHTVVTTVHGDGGRRAHRRIAFLAQKAEAKNEVGILMEQAALAFPIVVFVHKLANNARKVMEITECVVHDNGDLEYRVLYRYKIKRNLYHGGKFTIEGEFVKENTMSEDLREKLLRGGVPGPLLERFMGKEMISYLMISSRILQRQLLKN